MTYTFWSEATAAAYPRPDTELMYVNKQGFEEIRKALFKEPTFGRVFTTFWITWLFLGVRGLARFFQWIDTWLYPEYKDEQVDRPVFVFATPRSGTTLTHRLIGLDDEEFATIKLYQTLLPAVSATKFLEWLRRSIFGRMLGGVYRMLNAPLQARWKDIHELNLDKPEEDVATHLFSYHAAAMGLLFPFIDEMTSQIWLDKQPEEERKGFTAYYEDVLKRHIHASGGRRFLNKNVFFATKLMAMHERFDDAMFVYLIRNPYDAMPSFLNMFYRAWKAHSPGIEPDGKEVRALIKLGYAYYRYTLQCREYIPDDQFHVIRYEDLIRDPKAMIIDLYDHLGMPVSEAFEAKLDAQMDDHREYQSTHAYSLEQFGLTRDEVYNELRDVFEAYGYAETGEPYLEAAE